MEDEVLLSMLGDASEAVGALEEIDSSLSALEETISAVAASASELDGLDTSLQGGATSGEEMSAAMDSLVGVLAALVSSLDAVVASLAGLSGADSEAAGAEEDFAASLDAATVNIQVNTTNIVENTAAKTDNAAATAAADDANTNFAGGFKKLKSPLLLATAAVVGVGVAAVVMQAKYESAMSVVQALTGTSASDMAKLNTQVLAMAQDLGTSPVQLANGLYYLLSAGISTKDAMGVLKIVTEASAASFVDAKTDADALTSALNAYGQGAAQAQQYQDMLLMAVKDGKTTMELFAHAISRAAVTGSEAGFSFGEVSAAIATMTRTGDSAQRSSMQLANLIRAVGIQAATVAKHAKSMGLAFNLAKFQTMDLHDRLVYLWGITKGNSAELLKLTGGATGFLAASMLMKKGGATFTQIMRDMKNSSGMTAAAWKVHTQTMGYVWDKFRTTVEVALIEIGKALEPFAKALLQHLMPALANLGNWVKTHGAQAAAIFGSIAAILGGTLLGVLIAVAGAFIAANIEVIAIVAGIAALIAVVVGVVALFKHWYDTNAGVHRVLVAIGSAIRNYVNFALRVMRAELAFILPILARVGAFLREHLQEAAANILPPVRAAAAAVGQFAGQVQQRLGPVIAVWGPRLKLLATQAIAGIGRELRILQGIWNAAWPQISTVLQTAWGVIQGVVRVGWSIVSGIVKVGLDLLGGKWKQAWSDLREMTKGILGGLQQIVGSEMDGIKQSVLNMAHGVLAALAHIPGPLGDMARKGLAALDDMKTKTAAAAAQMAASMDRQTAQMELVTAKHYDQMRQKIEQELRNTKDPVKRHALEMRLAMVTNAEKMHLDAAKHAEQMASRVASHATRMKTQVSQQGVDMKQRILDAVSAMGRTAVQDVQTWFTNLKDKAGQLWNQTVTTIKTTVQNGFNWVKARILDAVQWVVDRFRWLYDHNYFFQRLVDAIRRDFTAAKTFITHIWTQVTGWLGAQWHRIEATAKAVWMAIVVTVKARLGQAASFIQDKITAVRTFIQSKWNEIKSDAEQAWQRFVSLITTKVAEVKTQVALVVKAILTPIQQLGGKMLDAGKNLMQMLINGIQSMAGAVGKAAGNIAGNIAKFLQFHSPAEEGPGSTADQWMPALGAMLEQGLLDQVSRVRGAAHKVAAAIAASVYGSGTLPGVGGYSPTGAGALPAGLSGNGGGSGVADQQVVTLLSAILQELRGNGAGANVRAAPLGATPTSATAGAITQQFAGGINFYGGVNATALFNLFNELAGYAQENGWRGATLGLGL